MLTRDQIAERLAAKLPGTERRVATGREREALETAQKLAERLETILVLWFAGHTPTREDIREADAAVYACRAWLRGEGE